VSLVARVLEENGIPTVVIGSARDVVEYCGVPRFLFTDYPLGNPCGRPYDTTSQRAIMSRALTLLEDATAPGTTVQSPLVWDESADWKNNYARVGADNREALRAAGEARRAQQAAVLRQVQATKV
jgi:hypothetical protein